MAFRLLHLWITKLARTVTKAHRGDGGGDPAVSIRAICSMAQPWGFWNSLIQMRYKGIAWCDLGQNRQCQTVTEQKYLLQTQALGLETVSPSSLIFPACNLCVGPGHSHGMDPMVSDREWAAHSSAGAGAHCSGTPLVVRVQVGSTVASHSAGPVSMTPLSFCLLWCLSVFDPCHLCICHIPS